MKNNSHVTASKQTSTASKQTSDDPIINEEADRRLGRMIIRYGLIMITLAILAPFAMFFVNTPQSHWYPIHKVLDWLSLFIIMVPFLIGTNRVFAARLEIGRDLVARREWRQAAAALEPFASPTQRFLDSSGEAHYLIAQAYAGMGEKGKAERARAFLRKHRRGLWTEKLQPQPAPKPVARVTMREGQEKRAKTSNTKRRRRF